MRKSRIAARDEAALRAALAEMDKGPEPGETERALQALALELNASSCRLADRRRERRSVRLQALALAGCSAIFVAFVCVACYLREFLLAKPEQWGLLLGFGALSLLAAGCLPVLIQNGKESNE